MVLKLMRQAEDRIVILVQGLRRFSLRKVVQTSDYIRAEIDLPQSILPPADQEWQAEVNNLRDGAARLIELTPDLPQEAAVVIRNITEPGQLADFLAPNLDIDLPQKQALLEELDVRRRVRAVQTSISAQLQIASIQQRLNQDVESQSTDAQLRDLLIRAGVAFPELALDGF